ncbi:cell division protein DedD [Xenorhabdus szentirmaii]|uniref:cell division protein DedD n=1 Tax=Xenorhabdus szentirmaii TaxID=290112 RepID=UPI0019AF2315|nr:cell division protein DedD [Xenorhabdus sp. 38]MBD2779961.1 cell division protein DedD [Xenorhabdus sp. 38]
MASKFQNRLVGTLALVAFGVIVLPMIFDGDKKYNENQFTSIPLVTKPGDEENIDAIPPLAQTMPLAPPEGAAEAMKEQAQGQQAPQKESGSEPPANTIKEPKSVVNSEVTPQKKVETKPQVKPESRIETPSHGKGQAPQATAYVVQLGALKNADNVNEIVAKLRLSGHQIYTIPSLAVHGQLTRIYVGPDASRSALESVLPELKKLTGLQGQIKNYKP